LVCAYSAKTVFGWGEITGNYEFGKVDKDLVVVHSRKVRWLSTEPISADKLSAGLRKKISMNRTLIELSEADFEEIQRKTPGGKRDASMPTTKGLLGRLSGWLAGHGLKFTAWQIATFYTALQTKGFVILAGISGTGKTKLAQYFAELLLPPNTKGHRRLEPNWLFVPVRPDWRDSKGLLGYYNPLTSRYEETAFLTFLRSACESFEAQEGLPWFLILDEMNLAHVEYYFADLLSVLESGRDEAGWTREPIRLGYSEERAPDSQQVQEIRIPPNLYIVGTVNTDETTYAFSPKVLDRAFTLELTEVEFSDYPPEAAKAGLGYAEQRRILQDFSGGGRFVRIDKGIVGQFVGDHREVREELERLNGLLREYNMHFGYRVFDEIVTFLACAERNQLFSEIGGMATALDAAVLMKVLPKFHGSRAKLEKPLRGILAWCVNPEQPNPEDIPEADKGEEMKSVIGQARYQKTAEKAWKMLTALYTDGFATYA